MPEADLYEPIQAYLQGAFPLVREGRWRLNRRHATITAQLDWIDGGPWMRPDLSLVHVHRRRFDPTPRLDLYTFEVKPSANNALAGLHQTLAHGRFADFVSFVLPVAEQIAPELSAQAQRFGVGLITFTSARDFGSYVIHCAPQRTSPDPDLREQFLEKALDAEAAAEVLDWLGISNEPKK